MKELTVARLITYFMTNNSAHHPVNNKLRPYLYMKERKSGQQNWYVKLIINEKLITFISPLYRQSRVRIHFSLLNIYLSKWAQSEIGCENGWKGHPALVSVCTKRGSTEFFLFANIQLAVLPHNIVRSQTTNVNGRGCHRGSTRSESSNTVVCCANFYNWIDSKFLSLSCTVLTC